MKSLFREPVTLFALALSMGALAVAGAASAQTAWRPKPAAKPAPPPPPKPEPIERVGDARWSGMLGFVEPGEAPKSPGAPAGNLEVPSFQVEE